MPLGRWGALDDLEKRQAEAPQPKLGGLHLLEQIASTL
jgi:hypothetical protein